MLEDLFQQVKTRFNAGETPQRGQANIPENMLTKCPRCSQVIFAEEFTANDKVCPNCGYHGRMTAKERLKLTIDRHSFSELDANMLSKNPISFPGYDKKQLVIRAQTGLKDAIVTGICKIGGIETVIAVMDSRYFMGSMGSVVGEKLTRAFELATDRGLPIICFTASGGARMQEGIVSLMQMAKTAGAVARHSRKGLLYMTVLTDPTTGGVTASFASLGDIIIAEPKVVIGFAGRRVIEGTIRQRLPDDFQLAEFMQSHGFVDAIVDRKAMRETLIRLLKQHGYTESKGEEATE